MLKPSRHNITQKTWAYMQIGDNQREVTVEYSFGDTGIQIDSVFITSPVDSSMVDISMILDDNNEEDILKQVIENIQDN